LSFLYVFPRLQQTRRGGPSPARFFVAFKPMKDFATSFYKSKAWKNCRDSYMESVSNLCEDCLAKGLYTKAEIAHHVIPLTPENIEDPAIALSWSNLRAVCRECHAAAHGARDRRYTVDQSGRVTVRL